MLHQIRTCKRFGWHGRTEITNGEHGVGTGGMVKIIVNEFTVIIM